jgi:hypothetical protein
LEVDFFAASKYRFPLRDGRGVRVSRGRIGMPTEELDDPVKEQERWTRPDLPGGLIPQNLAQIAVDYWMEFFDPLETVDGVDVDLGVEGRRFFLNTLRAVSWVESLHGHGGGVHPAEDPMQCGNPKDPWWMVLSTETKADFFKLRPPRPDHPIPGPPRPRREGMYAFELAKHVDRDARVDEQAKLKILGDARKKGHQAPGYNSKLSYFWAVPYLIHRINRAKPHRTYHFGSWRYSPYLLVNRFPVRLLEGAVAYNGTSRKSPNGVGDKHYRSKIERAFAVLRMGMP